MVKFLQGLPKDIARIIYSFVFEEVFHEIKENVELLRIQDLDKKNIANDLLGLLPNFEAKVLKSSKCKIHNTPSSNVRRGNYDLILSWSRFNFLSSDKTVCSSLIKSQDHENRWNKNFDSVCRYSIINGSVYHLVKVDNNVNLGEDWEGRRNNSWRLVPYFDSNYCWQDLAQRFLINKRREDYEKRNTENVRDNGCTIF